MVSSLAKRCPAFGSLHDDRDSECKKAVKCLGRMLTLSWEAGWSDLPGRQAEMGKSRKRGAL